MLKQQAMSGLMIYAKTGYGTKSNIAFRAKVACALKFLGIRAHFLSHFLSILLPFSVVGRYWGKCLSTMGSVEGLPHFLLEQKSQIKSLTRLIRKLFKLRFLWCDSCLRINALKTALSRRSNKILIHHFFPDTGMLYPDL